MGINELQKNSSLINKSNIKTVSVILLMVFIIIGYLFFFNSTKIFGENYDYTISGLSDVITLESGHTVKLTRADIDTEKNCVEYEFYFQNSNYDGCDDYNIDIKSTTRTGKITLLKTEIICSDSDIYVIRAELPKSWIAIVADITLKNAEGATLEGKFYSDFSSLYQTTIIGNSREYFLKLNTERSIERLKQEIENLYSINTELENKIAEIDSNIITLQERRVYMTAGELEEAETTIRSMSSERENCIRQIDDNKKLISEYTENISNLQEKL